MEKAREAVVALDYPVSMPDGTVTELTMRRPRLKEEIKYVPSAKDPKKQIDEEATYFAVLCGVDKEIILNLDMEDYEKVQKQYLFFRGGADAEEGADEGGGVS